ncbi:MAG: sensor histidine kinase [Chloroflexi bacterium]|nr:sensor histidine kinase [Chloroflexota bacterium]
MTTLALFLVGTLTGALITWLLARRGQHDMLSLALEEQTEEPTRETHTEPEAWLQALLSRDVRHPRWEDKFLPKPTFTFDDEEREIWEHVFWKVNDLLMPFRKASFQEFRMAVWVPDRPDGDTWTGYCYDPAIEAEQQRGRPCGFRLNVEEVRSLDELFQKRERYAFSVFRVAKERAFHTWHWARDMQAGLWAPIFHPEDNRIVRLVLFMHKSDPLYFEHLSRRQVIEVMIAHAALRLHLMWYRRLVQHLRREWLEWEVQIYRRFAQQLHDTLAQQIASIAMDVEYLYMRVRDRLKPDELQELNRIATLAREAATEARTLLFLLRPVAIEEEGLQQALEDLASRMKRLYGQNVQLDIDESILDKIDKEVQIFAFYIASEAATNARKHAKADTIFIRVYSSEDPEYFIVEVADNGRGFDADKVLHPADIGYTHYGLRSLLEQTQRLGGDLQILSEPGQGTTIRATLPYRVDHGTGERPEDKESAEVDSEVNYIEQTLSNLESLFNNRTLDTPASSPSGGL